MFVPWSFFIYIGLKTYLKTLYCKQMKKETNIVYVFLFIGIFNNILFGNLLTNPGFEDTPALTGWIRSGTLSSGVVTSPVVSGNYAARISTSAIAGNKALYQNVNVYEGKRYILSGYTYLIVAQGGESVGLGLKPGGGGVATERAANVSNSTSTTSQNTWVYLTLSTKVPLGINVIGVNIYLRTSGRLSTWATGYFDDISFVFISSPPGQVTGFVATTGSNGGEINLVWVSPTATVGYEDDLPTGCSFYIQYASWTGVNFSTTTQPPEGGYHIWIPTGPVIQGSYCYYTVSGLEEGVTYYFRIWAKDNAGNWSEISDGATAYTQITPLPPRSLTAFSISSSTIKLVWTPSNAVSYRIEHSSVSDSSGWIFRSTVSAAINEYIDENLSSNTTYWYRMFGINSAGGVNWSQPSVIVSTITYPAAPTGFTITTRTATSITWSWTAPAGGCDGYRIYRATDNSLIADQGSATTFEETGLSTNTAYGRFVRAYNIVGESLDSNHATFYTLAAAPVNLQVTEVYSSSITLVWENGGNPEWTRYGVARAEDENFTVNHTTVVTFTDNLTQLTVTVTGLGGSTTYYFRVWAYNGDGVESGYSNIVSILTHPGPPAAPIGFYAVALSTGSIKWEWNITKNATYYQIYDAYTNTLLANLEGNGTTTWVEVGLSSNTQYSRYVKSGNEYGLSDPSNVVSKYTLAYPPTSLTAIPLSSSTINLTWNYSGATKYQVWYSTDNINYYQTAIVDFTTVNYTHGNLVAGNTYYYKIVPVNGDDVANENFYSLIVPTRTLPSPIYSFSGSALTTTSIKWQWSSALGVDKYRIYSATDNSLIADQVSSTTFIETGLSTNTAYGRYVRAVNTSGLGELSPKTTVYTLAAIPTNLYFISVFYTSVTFTWSANGNPYGTKYEVSQSVDNFQTNFSTPISATFDTVVSISNLSPSTTYYFRVRAFNGDNIPTEFSQIVTTTTLSLPQVDICITEVLANDSHSTEGAGEFVEVYNRGSVEVNLAGMFLCGEGDTNDSIVDYTGTYDLGQSGTVLYPGWYALIVDPDYDGWYNNCIQQHADLNKLIMLTISGDTTLGSGGLKNAFGSVWITSGTVVLTSFTWVSDAGNGKSWEKIDYSGPAVDRSDSGNWAVSTHQSDNNSYCTPGFLNSVSSGSLLLLSPPQEDVNPSDVVINEFLYDAVSTDNGNEWIELYNNLSTKTVNLAGWKIQKSTGPTIEVAVWTNLFTITSGSISPNGYFLCAQSTSAVRYRADFQYSDSATMNNSAPFAIRLVTPSGKEIDRVAYGGSGSDGLAEGEKAAISVFPGQSLSRYPDGKDTNVNYNDFIKLTNPTPINSSGSDRIPPAAITSFVATSGDVEGSVKLSWVAAGDDGFVGVNYGKYEIKYATFTVETSSIVWWQQISGRNVFSGVIELKIGVDISTVQPANIVSYTITGLFPGLTYYFGIRTYDDVGNVSELDVFLSTNNPVFAVAFDTIPAKVQNVSVKTRSKTVELYWDKNTELDFHHYEIYCDSATGKIFVSSTTNTYFVHTGLRNGQTYYYELYAVDLKQNMSLPTTVYAIPKIAPPTNVTAKHYGTYVKLVWEHSIDFTTNDFMMYKIYRSNDKNVQFVSVSTTVSNEYQDVNVEKNVYYYYVVSVDKDGIESEPSNIAEAIPDLLPPKFVSISKLTSRDLAKINAKIDLKVVDDKFVVGDKEGKIISLEGKYRVVGSDTEYNVEFDPKFVSGSSEYIGSAEFEFSVITISGKGIEYQFIAKDEVNTSYYPSDGGWEKVLPSEDKPEQKFITSSNPEVVFGKEVDEVVIYNQQGNKVWEQKAGPNKIVVWKGQDKDNKFVESGAYIYQIKTKNGKRKYGVVIVVK